jgi:hypothetical protein
VAQAGKQFELRYKVDSQFLSHFHRVRKYVVGVIDGRNIGSGKTIAKDHNHAKQIGFVRQGDASGISFDLFKFATAAAADEAVEAESLEFSQGKIEITLQERRQVPGKNNYVAKGSSCIAPTVPSLPEGKKFFLAPSLTTASAGVHVSKSGFSTKKYVNVGPPAV